jgi:hypothetical protein
VKGLVALTAHGMLGGRGIHHLMLDKKMSASTVDQAGPDQLVLLIEQAPIDGFYFL